MKVKLFSLLFIMCVLSGCSNEYKIDPAFDSVSPSKSFIASKTKSPGPVGSEYWTIVMRNEKGEMMYRDQDLEFKATFPLHTIWDQENRFWLYSVESGKVYVWIYRDDIWHKHFWGLGITREYREPIQPPAALYPVE